MEIYPYKSDISSAQIPAYRQAGASNPRKSARNNRN